MLPCGHPPAAMFRYRHRGQLKRYCMACLFEKSGLKEAYAATPAESTSKPKEQPVKVKTIKVKKEDESISSDNVKK